MTALPDQSMWTTAVPEELSACAQWVTWQYEVRGDKRTKVPKNPRSNRNASTTDPGTWSTFADALVAVDWFRHDGIGFVLSKYDPYFFVDLDGAVDLDVLAPWAAEIVDELPECYWEFSPSGRGLHAIGRGTLPPGRRKKASIEIYDSERFCTITGRVHDGMATIGEDCTDALAAVHLKAFGPVTDVQLPPTTASAPSISVTFDDDTLLQRALSAQNGEKLQRILAGDVSGYPSQSEAESAAVMLLKFWSQDAAQIERILRMSSLQREKWDENKTYLARTIQNVLAMPTATYTPPANVVPIRSWVKGDDEGSEQRIEERLRLSDIGNGQRLADRVAGLALYCEAARRWYVYDGRRWNGDRQGALMEWAKESALSLYAIAAGVVDDKERGAVLKHAHSSESERSLKAAINLAKSTPALEITPEQFDRDAMALNVLNGTLDLRTGALRPHDPLDRISRVAPVLYDPDAAAPRFLSFLDEIFNGDQEQITYLQKVVGYCLTGVTNERAVFIAYGSGRNGKSTLSRLMMTLLGDYAKRTPTETIMARRNDGGIPNDLAALMGARFVTVSETEEGRRLNVSKVKDMSGDEPLTARFLHGEFFSFRPSFKLWISTNHKPVLPGSDRAIWDRFRLLPFDVRIEDEQVDKGLEAKLEGELDGILNWLLAGCMAWQAHGLTPPRSVAVATESYRQEMDQLGSFLAERCVEEIGASVTSATLFAAYKTWCESTNEKVGTANWLGRQMTERGYDRGQASSASRERVWIGVRLLNDNEQKPQNEHNNAFKNTNSDSFSKSFSHEEKNPGNCVPEHKMCSDSKNPENVHFLTTEEGETL